MPWLSVWKSTITQFCRQQARNWCASSAHKFQFVNKLIITDLIWDNDSNSKCFYGRRLTIAQRRGFQTTGYIRRPPSGRRSQWACSIDSECCCIAGRRRWLDDGGVPAPSHWDHSRWTSCLTGRRSHRVDAADLPVALTLTPVSWLGTESHHSSHRHPWDSPSVSSRFSH